MQAVIPPEATIALSGAVFALQLTVLGTLSIPSEANASIQIPIISDSNSGCSIEIQGYLTVISKFSVKQCAVSGAGVLRMPYGFVANNSIVVSVSQVEVSGFLVGPTGSQIRFQNSTLKLFSFQSILDPTVAGLMSERKMPGLLTGLATLSGFLATLTIGGASTLVICTCAE